MTARMWKMAMNAVKGLLSIALVFVAVRNNMTPLQSQCCGIAMTTDGWDSTGDISTPEFWGERMEREETLEFDFKDFRQNYTPPPPPPPPPPPRSEMEVPERELHRQGKQLRNVEGDGNCLFRAVAYQFSETEKDHPRIRACAIHTMRTCPENFIPFFVESDEGCIDYDAYVDTMAQDHKWGTHIEATAISKGLGLPVRIFRADPRTGTVSGYYCHGFDGEEPAISIDIAYHAEEEHYYAVEPLSEQAVGGEGAVREGEASPVEGTGTAPMS
eukprot:jgi/Undpi1/1500/HiC_scaffold_11.g04890.m1